MTRERLSSVDAAWLQMDDDTHPMTITVLLRFDGVLERERLATLLRERLLRQPRFRQRVAPSPIPGLPPSWEDDPAFELANHLHHVGLPAPKDEAALTALVSDLASTALDRRAPLWQLHVVDDAPGGSALVARLHHAIGDGVSLIHFLLSLTDEATSEAPSAVGLQLEQVPKAFRDRARMVADHAATLARLLALPVDPPTRLLGALGRDKRVAFSAGIPIEAFKRAGAKTGAKLNDVVMAVASGAMRRFLESHGESVAGLELRAMVPVFFRGHGSEGDLGNHFGLVFAPLLVGVADPVARLAEAKRRMDEVKRSLVPIVAIEVLELMGRVGPSAERIGIDIFTRKASAMITNVPGPPSPLHLAGTRLSDMVVWAPVAGHIGVGISLLSYAGKMRLGVFADARVMPHPDAYVRAFLDELHALGG